MSSGKEWPCGGASTGGGNTGPSGGNAAVQPVEEWSVHAQLTFTPQAGNIILTTHDGSSQQHQQHRCTADSGYSSERVMSPRSCSTSIGGNTGNTVTPLTGARATCSVTVAGHHTVTLTCSEVPFDNVGSGLAVPQQVPQVLQHVCQHQLHDTTPKPPPGPPPGYQPQFHHHLPPPSHHISVQPQQQQTSTPTHIPPVYKDVASQTSTTQVPQVVQSQLNKPKNSRHLVRSPARVKARSPVAANKSTASSSDGKKQPRTVHIDVYCTGSESTSSTSSEEETTSTPQTVFESNKAKVVHTRANSDTLPHALMKQKRRVLSNSTIDGNTSLGGPGGASGSTISTSYPSPRSSLVSHRSLASASTLSSLRTTTTNHSSTATSWKDTDLESTRSLLKCDSFDYDNSFDKLRIREKERLWATGNRPNTLNIPKDNDEDDDDSSSSSTDDSDEEGLAWSFGHEEDGSRQSNIRRENTVRRTSNNNNNDNLTKLPPTIKKSGSLSDSETSSSLRYKRESASRKMPYSPPSIFEHNMKAARFGPTVGSLRRPGHHVGPSKNPDCSCDTCRYYFEHVCYRNRTRSLGDRPLEQS